MWFVFTIVYHGVALAALYVTMRQFPSMNGWDFREMFFLYALWMTGHELHNTLFFTVVSVPDYVREGRFDRFLVRPLDTLFQVLTVPQQIVPDGLVLAVDDPRRGHLGRARSNRLGVRNLRAARRLGGRTHRSGHILGRGDLLVLVHPRRYAAVGSDVTGAGLYSVSDQHLRARRAHRADLRAAVCVHELLSGDLFPAESGHRPSPESRRRSAHPRDRAGMARRHPMRSGWSACATTKAPDREARRLSELPVRRR